MTAPLAAQEIENAYASLHHATLALYSAAREEADCRQFLERAKANALTSGEIDGKNAELRDAQVRLKVIDEQRLLDAAQTEVKRADSQLRVAQIDVERCKTLLKFMEVTRPVLVSND